MSNVSIRELGVGLYRWQAQHAVVEVEAPSAMHVEAFFAQFSPKSSHHNDRWEILSLLIKHQIDWPMWHNQHEAVWNAMKKNQEVFDPWQHAEASGVPAIEPMTFAPVYRALHQLCGSDCGRYAVLSWTTRDLVDCSKPLATTFDPEYNDRAFLRQTSAAVPAKTAPLGLLLAYSKRQDFAHCFRVIGQKAPRANATAIEMIQASESDPSVEEAFRSAPRWQDSFFLRAPGSMTWDQFQDFRYLLKGMASDLAAYYTGFPVFTQRA